MVRQRLPPSHNGSGFTLVELSIAIVIIGLIIGSVLVGRDLIGAAEIRSQISQIEKYQVAIHVFREKYGALPGDIKDPEATASGFAERYSSPGVEGMGDGNGVIAGSNYNANFDWEVIGDYIACGETGLFWRDLSTANLIDGSFTTAEYDDGIGNCDGDITSAASFNKYFPQAKIGSGSYVYVWSGGWMLADGTGPSNRINYFGLSRIVNPYNFAFDVSLTPNQAYAIDSKIDDGLPQYGRVLAMYPNGHAAPPVTAGCGMSLWAGGGHLHATYGQWNAGDCAHGYGPVTTTSGIITDPQVNYDAGYLTCFDNNGVAGIEKYSTKFMGGNNIACALSFQFQ